MSTIDQLNQFLANINHLGFAKLTVFKEIFPKIPDSSFFQVFNYPSLCGESIAHMESVKVGDKESSQFDFDLNSTNRTPLNCLYPLSKKEKNKKPEHFTIGSDTDNNLVIPDFTVSRHHAVINKKAHRYYLQDLGSEFGSYINGVSFDNEEILLNDGDQLSFGRYQFLFMEPDTLFEFVHKNKKKEPQLREEITPKEGEQLKQRVYENYHAVSRNITEKKFENVTEKILSIISFIPFFNAFSIYERNQLVADPHRLLVARTGETIIKENDASNNFYIVLKGKVSVVKKGSKHQFSSFGPGNCFGEIAFLTGIPRSADVVANESTILFTIDRDLYENIGVEIREKMKDQIIRQVSSNIIRQNRDVKDIRQGHTSAKIKVSKVKAMHAELEKEKARKMIDKFVRESPVFAKFTTYQKIGLTAFLENVKFYKAGEVIIEENALNDEVRFIIDGSAYITTTENDVVLSEIHAGDLFGEVSAFGKKKVSANVIAKEKTHVVSIAGDHMRSLPIEIREKMKDIALEQLLRRITAQNVTIVTGRV
ncbi:MAG: cyclic nucleotide-binding domain-containing protein [Magnetococcales bacterium]|nr:cyclic nucleotide-binding domain-containing protein [Magnetococcales bacterium]